MEMFTTEVIEKLRTYVYRLIDPRNGETFYVGKGQGNPVFAHVLAEIDSAEPSDKLKRIREIRAAGLEVLHIIHRHGMDEKTAFEVEAALIDAYPGLTNVVGGFGSNDFGAQHATEIVCRYQAAEAVFNHRAVLVNVNVTGTETSVYEAVRFAWKLNPSKAARAEIVVAAMRGMIVGVYVADEWRPATAENFPGRETFDGRYGFVGRDAPESIRREYVGRRIPESFRKRGASNPIKYTFE